MQNLAASLSPGFSIQFPGIDAAVRVRSAGHAAVPFSLVDIDAFFIFRRGTRWRPIEFARASRKAIAVVFAGGL